MGETDMFWFAKNNICPIGLDINEDSAKMVQLENNGKGMRLIAGGIEARPEDIQPGSVEWQRWTIDAVRRLTANEKFRGRDVISAIPANEIFIDYIKTPQTKDEKVAKPEDTAISKIRQKLPFEPDNAIIKYIPTEDDNTVVIATEREKIDRFLAIYEKADLQIKSIGIWPEALINCYVKFFGRRKSDVQSVAMLLDIGTKCTNVVICRNKNLLFARSIPIGTLQLETIQGDEITSLVTELTAYRRQLGLMYRNAQIERVIFISGQSVNKNIYTAIAKQLELPAHIGECLAAVEIPADGGTEIERRENQSNWAIAFGLSLSQER